MILNLATPSKKRTLLLQCLGNTVYRVEYLLEEMNAGGQRACGSNASTWLMGLGI
jgi:hypothetical protein